MSIYFNGVAGDNLTAASASITAGPHTFAAWGKLTVLGSARQVLTVGQSGSANDRYSLGLNASNQPRMQVRDATTVTEAPASAAVPDTTSWHLYVGSTITGDTDRSGYLDGGNRGNNHSTKTPSITPNFTRVSGDPAGGNVFIGFLAHVAMWNIQLSDADVAALACYTPNLIQPANLVDYWSFLTYGTTITSTGTAGTVLTVNGTKFSQDNPNFAACWPYSA